MALLILAGTGAVRAQEPAAAAAPAGPVTLELLYRAIKVAEAKNEERFKAVEQRFDAVDKRFDAVEQRLDTVDERFGAVNQRFGEVGQRFTGLEAQVDRIYNVVFFVGAAFSTLTALTIGLIFWDRRTFRDDVVARARGTIEKDGSVRDVIAALRDLAKTDNAMASVLRTHRLL